MTTHLAATMTLPAPLERVWAMLGDPSYLTAKCATATAGEFDVVDDASGGRTVTVHRTMPGEVPAIARGFLGDTIRLVERHQWPPQPGPERAGTLTIEVAGAPATVSGTLVLRADSAGSALDINLTIKVAIPLFGGTAEAMVRDELAAAVAQETDVARAWLGL